VRCITGEQMKELIQQWINRPALTEQEIEVRTWSFVVRSITCMVMVIAFMGVGAMGAISGRKGSPAPVEKAAE
jgi:predicted RNase H-related nuclease YkuK (DUF458 family)